DRDVPVDLGNHGAAIIGVVARLDDQIVTVANAGVDHRLSAHAQSEHLAAMPERFRYLEALLDGKHLERLAGGDVAEQRDRDRVFDLPTILQRVHSFLPCSDRCRRRKGENQSLCGTRSAAPRAGLAWTAGLRTQD